jgi:hypothetical protein
LSYPNRSLDGALPKARSHPADIQASESDALSSLQIANQAACVRNVIRDTDAVDPAATVEVDDFRQGESAIRVVCMDVKVTELDLGGLGRAGTMSVAATKPKSYHGQTRASGRRGLAGRTRI